MSRFTDSLAGRGVERLHHPTVHRPPRLVHRRGAASHHFRGKGVQRFRRLANCASRPEERRSAKEEGRCRTSPLSTSTHVSLITVRVFWHLVEGRRGGSQEEVNETSRKTQVVLLAPGLGPVDSLLESLDGWMCARAGFGAVRCESTSARLANMFGTCLDDDDSTPRSWVSACRGGRKHCGRLADRHVKRSR